MGCGGGGSDPEVRSASLAVRLVNEGTLIECSADKTVSLNLQRTTDGRSAKLSLQCPSVRLLSGDHQLSSWEYERAPSLQVTLRTPTTELPAPSVYRVKDGYLVQRSAWSAIFLASGLQLERLGPGGEVLSTHPSGITTVELPDGDDSSSWQWSAQMAGLTYRSPLVPPRRFGVLDTGYWGAMTIGDMNGLGYSQLVGTSGPGLEMLREQVRNGYETNGLAALKLDRDFRDVRVVDLNRDGLGDVVSNVYGVGCTMIGIQQREGGYAWSVPLRGEGTCIGGNGETILVADFDGDGLIDILLPSYQRFDFLRNLGGGQFVEVADELGISFPNYSPNVEGAAAVDLNFDGAVDIVIANEILINDAHGGFVRHTMPYGPEALFDEGLSVADLDNDGRFDIVKHHPADGPRVFWGSEDSATFTDGGSLLEGSSDLASSFGIAVGDITFNGLGDIVFAGGAPAGRAPTLCLQDLPRSFVCKEEMVAVTPGAWQDLLLVADMDADGRSELLVRDSTIKVHKTLEPAASYVVQIDLRDAAGLRTLHGRAVRVRCATDGSFVGVRTIDGGNGYMAQGNYAVAFMSDWCDQFLVETPVSGTFRSLGVFSPGRHVVRLADASSS